MGVYKQMTYEEVKKALIEIYKNASNPKPFDPFKYMSPKMKEAVDNALREYIISQGYTTEGGLNKDGTVGD